jgi:hypothetical protein
LPDPETLGMAFRRDRFRRVSIDTLHAWVQESGRIVMAILLPEYKIAYFDTPKVASSSIKVALYRLEHGAESVSSDTPERKIHRRHPARRLDPAHDFAEAEGYWKCAVVRDPVKRLLSAYSNRIIHHRDQLRGRFPKLRAFFLGLPLDPDPDVFFTRLGRYRLQSGWIRHHVNLCSYYIGTDLSRFDAVYPIEKLDDFARELSRRTGTEVVFPRLQTGGPKITADMLSPRAYGALLDYLDSDYGLLADYYNRPARAAA